MAAAVVGTPLQIDFFTSGVGGAYTAEAGSSRAVVLVLLHSSSAGGGTPVYTGVQPTFGGVNMTQVGPFVTSSTARYMCLSIWRLLEASIPSGSQTVVASWNSGTNNLNEANALGCVYTLTGVDQTTPVTATGSGVNNGVTTIAPSGTASTTGGVCIYGSSFNAGSSTGVTLPSGYTSGLPTTSFDFSGFGASGYKAIGTGGTETPTTSWTAAANAATLVANFQAAGSGNTLVGANGTYVVTGEAAALKVAQANAFGSYGMTGQAATFVVNASQLMLASVGSFVLTGGTSNSQFILPAANGAYTFTGEAANLSGPTVAGAKGSLLLLGVGN